LKEWDVESGPELMKICRACGIPSKISNAAQVNAMVNRLTWPRSVRSVGAGAHLGVRLLQLPSGSGPLSHFSPERLQRQRPLLSPGKVSSDGAHSAVAWQRPRRSGPKGQGRPSAA